MGLDVFSVDGIGGRSISLQKSGSIESTDVGKVASIPAHLQAKVAAGTE